MTEVYPPAVNVLSEEKKQQVIALARLGWSLLRIQHETHIRRETAAGYLKAAGIALRPPGGLAHQAPAMNRSFCAGWKTEVEARYEGVGNSIGESAHRDDRS